MAKFSALSSEKASSNAWINNIDKMHSFANEKYDTFSKIWTEFDESAFACGIVMAVWLFMYHCLTSFDISKHE